MAITVADIQQQILLEIGANIPDLPDFSPEVNVAYYWELQSQFSDRVQQRIAMTKVGCIEFLIGQLRDITNAGLSELSPGLGEKLQTLSSMLQRAYSDFSYWQDYYNKQRVPVIAQITKQAPVIPGQYQNDPNSRRLRGDAIERPINGL